MKNRRTIIVAFMLCAVMLLGIGYAALNDALKIDGVAQITQGNVQSAFDLNVFFSDAVANQAGDDAYVDSRDNDIANFKCLNLAKQGDKATFTFTIKNASDLDASVTPVLTYAGDATAQALAEEYFNVYSDWKNQETGVVATKILNAGEVLTYTVTVELKKTPALTEGSLINANFIINLSVQTTETESGGGNVDGDEDLGDQNPDDENT